MTEANTFEFTVKEAGHRLDKLVVDQLPDLSRAQIQNLIKEGLVTVNGAAVKSGVKLRGGETIQVTVPAAKPTEITAESMELTVIYEDADLAVIDKPAGLVVHLGTGVESGTLVNALLARYPEVTEMQNGEGRQGIVHRLDKETSGLIVIARNDVAQRKLAKQFQDRTVEKTYLALVERAPKTPTGRIEAPIGRDRNQRKRMAVVREGKPAITEYKVIDTEFRDDFALVEVHILTGRTHQIRVHMAFIGCPIVGDTVYGFRKQRVSLKRYFLHAAHLAFDHPRTGERLSFNSELPPALKNTLEKLR